MNCQMKYFTIFSGRPLIFLGVLVIVSHQSCSKIIDVPVPVTSLTENNIYTNDEAAIAVLTGIYTELSYNSKGLVNFATGVNSFSLLAGLSADELDLYSGITFPRHLRLIIEMICKLSQATHQDQNIGKDYIITFLFVIPRLRVLRSLLLYRSLLSSNCLERPNSCAHSFIFT